MEISRHFVDIEAPGGLRRVHYRRCGQGPALLMVHQSPRSSAEYEPLMRQWGAHFTCIAPDTPGFGQSDPLPDNEPGIDDFADAIVALIDRLGIGPVAAYGFHSGGIILVTALKRHPEKFRALAVGGYAIWTPAEMALFGEHYLPPFLPSAYGEHLTWLWNRMLEQSWFFPWFDVRTEARLSVAHADVARVDAAVREMLDAGAAYRAGYGAVLRAPRDIPPVDAVTPPVLITAYDGDPLQAHIDRLGPMPAGWSAAKVATPAEHQAASLAFLRPLAGGDTPPIIEADNAGFVQITTNRFAGLIHWRGPRGSALHLVAPGSEAAIEGYKPLPFRGGVGGGASPFSSALSGMPHPEGGALESLWIDVPGHGLSDDWPGVAPTDWADWQAVIAQAATSLGATGVVRPPLPAGDPDRLFPDLTPDRFGSHLTRAWAIVRARAFFDPWYEAGAATAREFASKEIEPTTLALAHRALIRARSARHYLIALRSSEGED